MNIKEREDELFKEWLQEQPMKDFAFDGVVNEKDFNDYVPRLVIVLKDTNGGTGHWSLSELIARGNHPGEIGTWYPIAKWLARLGSEDVPLNDVKEKARLFRRIAVVNLKKTPGEGRSAQTEVKKFVHNEVNCSFLSRQFRLYMDRPTIFACCGRGVVENFEYCMGKLGVNTRIGTDGVSSLGGCCSYFRFRHPNCSSNKDVALFAERYEKARNMLS